MWCVLLVVVVGMLLVVSIVMLDDMLIIVLIWCCNLCVSVVCLLLVMDVVVLECNLIVRLSWFMWLLCDSVIWNWFDNSGSVMMIFLIWFGNMFMLCMISMLLEWFVIFVSWCIVCVVGGSSVVRLCVVVDYWYCFFC